MKIHISGTPYHVKVMKEHLSSYFTIGSFEEAEVIYHIFGPGPSFKRIKFWFFDKRPLIVHWIGSDVLNFLEEKKGKEKVKSSIRYYFFKKRSNDNTIINLTSAPWLSEELKKVNIQSYFVPITTLFNTCKDKLNSNREVDFLSYVPLKRFSFYGGNEILKFARMNRKYSFILLIPDLNEIPSSIHNKFPKNITIFPKISFKRVQNLLSNTKCFLRLTRHDGLSLSVLEALQNECQVLWSYEFPYVKKVEKYKFDLDAKKIIENWSPNIEGSKFVSENFSNEKIYSNLKDIIVKFAINTTKYSKGTY